MKNLKIKNRVKYFLYTFLCAVFFTSCHNHINEYTVVKSVELYNKKQKYKVELEFYVGNQYLYTNKIYQVGDTLYLSKKYCP
jgi:hypothetical protein